MYGHAIGVTYRGQDAYKTRLGALVTLITYVLMTINSVSLFIAYEDGSRQEEKVQSVKFDRATSDEINLLDLEFEISIVTSHPLDPRVGRFKAF